MEIDNSHPSDGRSLDSLFCARSAFMRPIFLSSPERLEILRRLAKILGMFGGILLVIVGLIAFVGIGALILALAESMARGPENFGEPVTRIYVRDWRDFEACTQDRSTQPNPYDGEVLLFPVRSKRLPKWR